MSATPPIWPGPRLFVPITVDALVLGQPNLNNRSFADLQVPYQNLSPTLGLPSILPPTGYISPNPAQTPYLGVNLLWTLPYGMRSGQSQLDGSVAFPLLPNRWVVLRSFVPASGASKPQLTAFVIESDFVSLLPGAATSAYPDPQNPGQLIWIGRKYDLSAWTGGDPPPKPFLRAVAPGNVSFTAAYQNVQNVFALNDLPPDTAVGEYSYFVCGFYNPLPTQSPGVYDWTSDPLLGVTPAQPDGFTTQDAWQSLMAGLLWQVGDGSDGALADAQADWAAWQKLHPVSGGPSLPTAQQNLASQTLCHGGVYGLQWQGKGASYPSAASRVTATGLAVGNTATEALGAWLGNVLPAPTPGASSVENLVEAFQSGRVDQFTTDPVAFYTSRHDAEFGTLPAGTLWTVVPPNQSDPTTGQQAANQSVPLDATATGYLVQLNASQAAADVAARTLESQQYQLYSIWYFYQLYGYNELKLLAGITALQASIAQTQKTVSDSQTQANSALSTLTAYLQAQPAPVSGWQVKANPAPAYQKPNDPVILIAGAGLDDKLLRPGAYDDGSGNLVTRFSGQSVTGLSLTYNGCSATITAAMVQAAVLLPTTQGTLPPEVQDLWLEALLLDGSAAPFLATLFFANAQPASPPPTPADLANVTALIQSMQTLSANASLEQALDPVALAAAAGIQGTAPEYLSFQPWQQPWTPLCVDWKVSWFPTAQTQSGSLQGWQLGEIDYECSAPAIPAKGQPYSGRTLLNAQSALGLQSQLEAFIAHSPVYPQLPLYQQVELQQIVAQMGKWDVITQPMADLTQMLLMRQPAITAPLSNPFNPDLAAAVEGAVGSVDKYAPITSPANPPPFFPIRSGHLQLTYVNLVDVFGQLLGPTTTGVNFSTPVIAEPMQTFINGQLSTYLSMPPRFSQPARLDFALLQADDDRIRSNSSDTTSPVAGYLVPNFLDGSLTVFDAAGQNQGAVQPVLLGAGAGVRWDAVPGSLAPLGAGPTLANGHMQALIQALLQSGQQGAGALADLLGLMDGTQWMTDPHGGQDSDNLSALVGRPLAVVRASIALQLEGWPAYNQSVAAAQAYAQSGGDTQGFTTVTFYARVGDLGFSQNGVVGYFLDDDYTKLYAVYGYQPVTKGLHAALARGGTRAAVEALATGALPQDPGDGFLVLNGLIPLTAAGGAHTLTLLVSPRGTLPAISGALPVVELALAPGPTTAAFAAMRFTFRTGPLLTDPNQLRMPLPADIRGKWSWVQRTQVTTWSDNPAITPDDAVARITTVPSQLSEGWLSLSNAETPSGG